MGLLLNIYKYHMSNNTATVLQFRLERKWTLRSRGGFQRCSAAEASRATRLSTFLMRWWVEWTYSGLQMKLLLIYEKTCCTIQKQTEPVCKNVQTFLAICVFVRENQKSLTDCIDYGTSEQPNWMSLTTVSGLFASIKCCLKGSQRWRRCCQTDHVL